MEGRSLFQVYLPASEWNDELIYYKQVEGMIKHGSPLGYFGFNESHSRLFSFAAWSPVLVWPWILWGLVFGWNIMSPVYCNLVFFSLAIFLFAFLVKPDKRQMGLLALLFACFTPFNRYLTACMPEIICFSMAVVVLGLGISYLERERTGKLSALFILTAVMTLMRPYLLLFMLLPVCFLIQKKKCKGVFGSLAVMLATLCSYMAIKYYMSADYFAPLFKTDWVTAFRERGLFGGIGYMLYQLAAMGRDFLAMAYEGFKSGLPEGAYFGSFLTILLLLLLQVWHNYRKKQKKQIVQNGFLAVCFIGMLGAVLLMYKLFEGSRHLVTFIAVGIFAVGLMETKFFRKAALLGAVFVYLHSYRGAVYPLYYGIPFKTESRQEEVEAWREIYEKELALNTDAAPGYDNVVIWQLSDRVDGTELASPWQLLYGLPAGFGISCCKADYLLEHYDALQSKYLMTIPGGEVDALCREKGAALIGESEKMLLYQLR